MLPKTFRFPLRQAKNFFKDARRFASPPFLFYIEPEKIHSHARAAVVIPKKVSKSAVVRNTFKRQIHEQLASTLPHLQSLNIVVYVTRPFTPQALPYILKALEKYKKLPTQEVSAQEFTKMLSQTSQLKS